MCCNVLQFVAVCCSVLQCVALWCSQSGQEPYRNVLQCVAMCCNVLQWKAVQCSVLQCVASRMSCWTRTLPKTSSWTRVDLELSKVIPNITVLKLITQLISQYNDTHNSSATKRGKMYHLILHVSGILCVSAVGRGGWGKSQSSCDTHTHVTHCNTLQHTATHCSTLQHTATHCNTLQHTATHCNTLQHTHTYTRTPTRTQPHTQVHNRNFKSAVRDRKVAPNSIKKPCIFECRAFWWHTHTMIQHTATHCNALQHTATHCNTLQRVTHILWYTATHCNTLQDTAAHCSILQHTVTRCSTLQHDATYCNTVHHAKK